MEVHAHSHTERKKWFHYFWEFLMLFLAVTLGFFVENQREHMIEHQREKQYIKSLLFDLKADIVQGDVLKELRIKRIGQLDTLMRLLKSSQLKENTSAFYYNVVPSQFNGKFLPHNGALFQLKNAGGLRLIRKANVVDSILHFDVQTQSAVDFENWERERLNDLSAFNRVVDGSVVEENSTYTYPGGAYNYQRPSRNPALLSYNKKDLEQLYNRFNLQKRMHSVAISNLYQLKGTISRLINLLDKEYHLK
jgi:hypothetical protein